MTLTHSAPSPLPPTYERGMMRKRHRPLARLYHDVPSAAWIVDRARTVEGHLHHSDPVHGALLIGSSMPIVAPLSIHDAVGGDHDGPNPGDYLAAALVGCFDSTMRVVADRLGVVLEELSVEVKAEVDVRGTLMIDAKVPVGFQRMTLTIDVKAAEGTPKQAVEMLLQTAEHCCVVMQTLRKGVDVRTEINGVDDEQ